MQFDLSRAVLGPHNGATSRSASAALQKMVMSPSTVHVLLISTHLFHDLLRGMLMACIGELIRAERRFLVAQPLKQCDD